VIRIDPTQPLASDRTWPRAATSFPLGIAIVTVQDVPAPVPGPSSLPPAACLHGASLLLLATRS